MNGAKQFITNSGPRSPASSRSPRGRGSGRTRPAVPSGPRSARSSCPAARPASPPRSLRQARLARLGHAPPHVPGRPRPGGQPARRAGPQLRPVPRHPRRRPGGDRGAGGRLHPGLPRPVPAVRRRRQTFGVPIGHKQGVAFQIADLEVMLHASRLLTYKAAALKDSMVDGGGASMKSSSRRPRSPSCTTPSPPSPPPGSPPRCSAATASWRSTPSPASTATRRSSRSARSLRGATNAHRPWPRIAGRVMDRTRVLPMSKPGEVLAGSVVLTRERAKPVPAVRRRLPARGLPALEPRAQRRHRRVAVGAVPGLLARGARSPTAAPGTSTGPAGRGC